MSIDTHDIDGEDLSAAEFALGLLDSDARRMAQARLRDDAAFASEVARWESRFAPWLQAIDPVEAPAGLWPRIRTTLWSHELPRSSAVTADRVSPWKTLALWRGLAIGGLATTAASLVLLTMVLRHAQPASTPPRVVIAPPQAAVAPMAVVLRGDDGSVAYTATLDATGTVVVTPVQNQADPRAPELWLIPAGDKPHSLGMLPRDRAVVVHVPSQLRRAARGSLFAVTMEPAGSGPHEAPTGPVVAKGTVTTL